MTMTYVSAIALTTVEYNGSKGRASVNKDSVISDLTEEECVALERLKAVRRLSPSPVPAVQVAKISHQRPRFLDL